LTRGFSSKTEGQSLDQQLTERYRR
jgi:hypothetical protein